VCVRKREMGIVRENWKCANITSHDKHTHTGPHKHIPPVWLSEEDQNKQVDRANARLKSKRAQGLAPQVCVCARERKGNRVCV
jgi:hypothetical protein